MPKQDRDNFIKSRVPRGSGVNWFRRHLNWTLLLVWLGVPFVLVVVSDLTGVEGVALLIIPWLWIVTFGVWWWVLSCKGRSHWWMLLGGLGMLVTFGLRNEGCETFEGEAKKGD